MKSQKTISRVNGRTRHGGFIVAEAIVATTVLGMLIAGLAIAQEATRRLNLVQVTRQRCLAAGQAQLDSLAAQGRPVPKDDLARLWPTVKTKLTVSDGKGQWQGLKLVTVTATSPAGGNEVIVESSRYYSRPVEVGS